jgi:glycosyltransferase involved in cell wall biosynthesis
VTKRVCLVSGGNVSTNPRLVNAADALQAAGHRVRVVAVDALPENAERDAAVMRDRTWRLDRVNLRHGDVVGIAHRVAAKLLQVVNRRPERIMSPYADVLTRAVSAEPADVVLGYTFGGLPVAVRAAERLGAIAGFDIEDLHAGERPDEPPHAAAQQVAVDVERRYLRRCRTLTAASEGIADAVAAAYGVPRPLVVLNTFPLAERPAEPIQRHGPPSLYWYSAVIGTDRGIEDALGAMALLDVPVELHLRGSISPQHRAQLEAQAARLGVARRLFFWPQAPPPELVSLAAQHDIGLALELGATRSRRIAVTNKLLVYLLAGIAVAATDIPGQRGIIDAAPGAGFLYPPGDTAALAAGLESLLANLPNAKAASRMAGERRFNWEAEAPRLVRYLEEAWGTS